MKLYYAPGTCSLAPHILLRETGLDAQLVRVDIRAHRTEDGADYTAINSRGQVPVLELDDGSRLTEGPVIAQFIADRAKRRDLMPEPGSLERYRVMEWQNYVTSELHKSFGPLFDSALPDDAKAFFRAQIRGKFAWVDGQLRGRDFLTGSVFTAADAYLFVVTTWARPTNVDLDGFAHVAAFRQRVAARASVHDAMKAEGLLG